MKISIIGKAKIENGIVKIMKTVGAKIIPTLSNNEWTPIELNDSWEAQKSEPIDTGYFSWHGNHRLWLFKGLLIHVKDVDAGTEENENIKIHIKHLVYKKDKNFSNMKKEIERFERFEKQHVYEREPIPESVRIYVWRRDGGKCVVCGTDRDLEFDHIIPLSKGGNSTERNLQILCSNCNKSKSNNL